MPDSISLVEQLPALPELQRAEALRPLAAEPIVDKLVRTRNALMDMVGAPCFDLCERRSELRLRTDVS